MRTYSFSVYCLEEIVENWYFFLDIMWNSGPETFYPRRLLIIDSFSFFLSGQGLATSSSSCLILLNSWDYSLLPPCWAFRVDQQWNPGFPGGLGLQNSSTWSIPLIHKIIFQFSIFLVWILLVCICPVTQFHLLPNLFGIFIYCSFNIHLIIWNLLITIWLMKIIGLFQCSIRAKSNVYSAIVRYSTL